MHMLDLPRHGAAVRYWAVTPIGADHAEIRMLWRAAARELRGSNGTRSETVGMTAAANPGGGLREPGDADDCGPGGIVSLEAVSDGGSHGMGEVAYRSTVSIERDKGPLRWARLPAEPNPIAFGVHSEVARHYGVTPDTSPPHATTLDYLVAAAAG
jgi:hypothetical protein